MARKISELYEMQVYTSDGQYLGITEDFVFDDVEGKLAALVVSTGRRGERRTIPYDAVKACKDIYIVQV
ncbi:MAG: PRC-barrel domain-containing protein [Candidatus Korarchaeota archaeon]|nr:PRC-barrel domain-containing protein [Candidatus Korarchaeota archaeon]